MMTVIKNLITKFKVASPAAKASMAFLFANLVLKGLSMISGPIFTRLMPTSEYGIISTFSSWQALLTVIVTLNLSSGVFNNGMLDYKDNRDEFEFSLLAVSTISAMFFFGIYSLFSDTWNSLFELPPILIYLMFIYFIFVPAYGYWSGRQRYEYKYKLLVCITIGISLFSLVLGIIAVYLSPDSSKAVAKIMVSESVNIVVGIIFFVYLAFKARFKIRISYCIYALKFNLPLILHYLSMYVLGSSDRIMISKMVGTAATAIYSVAYTAGMVINIVWQSIEASLSPWIYENLSAGNKEKIKSVTLKIVLLFAVLCITCTLFAPEIMNILAPKEYQEGIFVIPSVAAGVFFTAVYSLYMRIELYYKKTGFASIATVVAAILNLILNYIFINSFGYFAAGYTTMVCYFLLYVFHFINVKKNGFADNLNNRGIAVVSILVILLSVSVTMLYRFSQIRYFVIFIMLILFYIKRRDITNILKRK